MNGMSAYEFEKLLAYQTDKMTRQARNAWMLKNVRVKRWWF